MRNTLVGSILLAGALPIAAFVAILSLAVESMNVILIYVIGAIWGLGTSLFSERYLVVNYKYFDKNYLAGDNANEWATRIKEKRYIKRWQAYLTFLPCLIVFVATVILAVTLYPILSEGTGARYTAFSAVAAIIGCALTSMPTFIILGISALNVCKNCGCVNTFIYVDTADSEAVSFTESKTESPTGNWRNFFKIYSKSYGGKSGDADSVTDRETVNYERRVDTASEKVVIKCDFCGKEFTVNEIKINHGKWHSV